MKGWVVAAWIFGAGPGCSDPGSGVTANDTETGSGSTNDFADTNGPVQPSSTSGVGESSSGRTSTGSTATATGSTTEPDASGATGTSGGPDEAEFCPPHLGRVAREFVDAYNEHFDDAAGMRASLALFPGGSGHWGQTYTLRSLMLMYELTGEIAYLHELMWQAQALEELLSDTESWPTGVCGNSFVHDTVVIDARLLAPMLRAAWWMQHSRLADDAVPEIDGRSFAGATYGDVAASYAVLAESVLAGHEGDLRVIEAESFGPEQGRQSAYYRFPASYSCVASEVMPFNYANSAGTAYAELWRLTGDDDARAWAERLLTFWWNRTYAYQPSPSSSRSRWWAYRGEVSAAFDPDSSDRPEDGGHADMSSTFALRAYALGLQPMNGTRLDQIALASKRWIDRAVNAGTAPAELITNDDTDGEWRDLFDHLPMSCLRPGIHSSLADLAPSEMSDGAGGLARSGIENIAELAYFSEFELSGSSCGPVCGDGVCQGPEDAVGCAEDCGPVPERCE